MKLPEGAIVLHDLTINILGTDRVQIDTVILTKSVAYILEIKNIYGKLELMNQPARLKRTTGDGKVRIFDSPIIQLEHAIDALTYWLFMHDIQMPVKGAVFLASRNVEPLFPGGLPIHLVTELPSVLRKELSMPSTISAQTVEWIASALRRQEDTFHPYPVAEYFDIIHANIYTNSLCSDCFGLLLTETNRTGTCLKCGKRQWIPFIENLVDYFLIFGQSINNVECQEYLEVSRSKSTDLLSHPYFISFGRSNAVRYKLNFSMLRFNVDGKLLLPPFD